MITGLRNIFNSEIIRDTLAKNSVVVNLRKYNIKNVIIENGLDQAVNLQYQASANSDFSNSFNVGNSFNVASNFNTYTTCDDFFPYFRIVATCNIAPLSGTLAINISVIN